jgi:hypothetical protein
MTNHINLNINCILTYYQSINNESNQNAIKRLIIFQPAKRAV